MLSFAQSKIVENINVSQSKVTFLGKSKPIKELTKYSATSQEKKAQFKSNKKVPKNFENRLGQSKVVVPELEHQGVDPLVGPVHSFVTDTVETILSFNGLSSGFGSPSDPTGSVGLDYYVQAVNVTNVGVWTKDGERVTEFSMNTLWSNLGASSAGDPIILFDQERSQWIITEFTDPANLLIAVSETSDPLGSYFAYSFSTPNFPDYPKYGIWSDHLVVTSNESTTGSGRLHQYFIDRAALMSGSEDVRLQRVEIVGTQGSEQGFIVSTPVDWEGTVRPNDSKPIVLKLNDSSWGEVENDAIELYRFNINYDDANLTEVESILIETSPYDSYPCASETGGFACVPQPNGNGLDALPEFIMHVPPYRNFGTHESIALSFVTDATDGNNHAAIRWMELRKTISTDWALHQEGTYAPDSDHRFMPGISMDRNGNIGLAYNVVSDSTFAGMRFTGRYADDSLGIMTIKEAMIVDGQSTLQSGGRFADYSHISVDPVDESTFWFTSEYAGPSASALTRIASFKLALDTFDLALTEITSPQSSHLLSNSEIVEVKVKNNGLETVGNYEIGFMLDGVEIERITIPDSIRTEDTKTHSFNTGIDLSAIGEYEIKAFVVHNPDDFRRNDTFQINVVQRAAIDGILAAQSASVICEDVIPFDLKIANNGGATLSEAIIDVNVNGNFEESVTYPVNLEFSDITTVNYEFSDITQVDNTFEFILRNDAGPDFDPSNNTAQVSNTIVPEEGSITIVVTTDEYPNETTWILRTQSSAEVIASGGPYDLEEERYVVDLCLDPEICYSFIIFDSLGDGICCGFGEGGYEIISGLGQTIVLGSGEFSFIDSANFCPSEIECELTVSFDISDADDNNGGTILIEASGGTSTYLYSIDGENFQEENIFTNLPPDDYTITVITDDENCIYEETVTVGMISSSEDLLLNDVEITATPNPTEGVVQVSVANYATNKTMMSFKVYNAEGSFIQQRNMSRYDGVFTTQLSIYDYPAGVYYLKFMEKDLNKLIRIVKL